MDPALDRREDHLAPHRRRREQADHIDLAGRDHLPGIGEPVGNTVGRAERIERLRIGITAGNDFPPVAEGHAVTFDMRPGDAAAADESDSVSCHCRALL